jgi:hypothetical protein
MVGCCSGLQVDGSAVGIATGYGLDDRGVGVRVPVGPRIFTSRYSPDRSEAHPAFYPMDCGCSLPEVVKLPGHEADHSPPTSAEVKNI